MSKTSQRRQSLYQLGIDDGRRYTKPWRYRHGGWWRDGAAKAYHAGFRVGAASRRPRSEPAAPNFARHMAGALVVAGILTNMIFWSQPWR